MQVLDDNNTEGLLSYGRLVNDMARQLADGQRIIAKSGLATDTPITSSIELTNTKTGQSFWLSLSNTKGDD